VIDYTTSRGDALQAALYYPAGYIAGHRYPTIVTLYERLSDEVHDYVSPSDMDESNIAIFTELGYCVIAPDIRYRPRDPGVSTVDAVTAAVARAVALGVTDAARVGVIGHSWGAYESAFLATHTVHTFAAAVAGSPITDLISQYGDHHWSTGIAETDHIETGQQRMQVPYWDDVDAYVRNSPIFGVPNMTTPLLLEAGDQDGEVFWHQSVELYNAARRAGKPVVLLQYLDEDHALDNFDNRRDYQRRILAWFGHFLKSETAPPWITTGTPLIKRSGT
jgi:dipeptidyl aminopeptidase/acylaminoacyl peptidase